MRKKIIQLLNQFNLEFKEKFGYDKTITRDYFVEKLRDTGLIYSDVMSEFGSFSNLKAEIKYKRTDFNIKKDHSDKKDNRKYFITSYIPGSEINENCLKSIKEFLKKEKAELVLIVESGVDIKASIPEKEFEEIKDYLVTEIKLNNNLVVKDFYTNPQQVNPLTGIDRYKNKTFSVIVGSPKQFMKVVPSRKDVLPHLVYSTGTVCNIEYKKNRSGTLANQDQKFGGLVVEIKDKRIFFVRNVEFDDQLGFYDLGVLYGPKKKRKQTGIVWGDLHLCVEDQGALNAAIHMSKKIDNIFIHDIFNGISTLRHERSNMIARLNRKDIEKSLQNELNYVGEKLEKIARKLKKSTIYIVNSNHDRFLNDYLSKREFINDEENILLSCELFIEFYKGNNPIEYYLRKHFKIDNVVFLKLEESKIINGFQCGYHGDKGHSGGKGSIKTIENVYPYAIIGHSHSPAIFRSAYQTGCLCDLDQNYSKGQGSKWCHGNVLINPNGTRQQILIIEGEYKI